MEHYIIARDLPEKVLKRISSKEILEEEKLQEEYFRSTHDKFLFREESKRAIKYVPELTEVEVFDLEETVKTYDIKNL